MNGVWLYVKLHFSWAYKNDSAMIGHNAVVSIKDYCMFSCYSLGAAFLVVVFLRAGVFFGLASAVVPS